MPTYNFDGTPATQPVVGTPAALSPACGGTWLSLDRWAQIIGINPLHFHQLSSSTLLPNNVCGDVFFQSAWQHSDRVGRDEICMAIQQAEQEISREVGFNLMPDWTVDERLVYPRPALSEAYGSGFNVRGEMKSVEVSKGYLISGGVKAQSLITAGVGIVRSDADGDGYAETCTVTTPTSVTDVNEIHLYYPGQSGSAAWEIRPITPVISGGSVTITFKVWQVALLTSFFSINPQPMDAEVATNFETTADVYRIYNDPSTQVQFLWENNGLDCCGSCVACQLGTQEGCMHFRNARLGFIVPSPATWDASALQFTGAEWSACREPDQVRLWYYSGYRDKSATRPYAELSTDWEYAIAYYAASKLDRPVCGCSNVNSFIEKWRRDAAFSSLNEGGFTVTSEQASNRLGTSMGALYAYRTIQRLGVRINK